MDTTEAVARIEQELDGFSPEERWHILRQLLLTTESQQGTLPEDRRQVEPKPAIAREAKLVKHELDPLTYRITGCAMAVHRQLGYGLREADYQRALELQLRQTGLNYRPQQKIAVYEDLQRRHVLGYYIPDFIVEDSVVVEIKALEALGNTHVAQVISYLAVTECRVGLLINFGERVLRWRRIFPPIDLQAYRVNTHWLWNPSRQREVDLDFR